MQPIAPFKDEIMQKKVCYHQIEVSKIKLFPSKLIDGHGPS